jgi:hypothetical protein
MSLVEVDILSRVIAPENPSLERKVAEAVLAMAFTETDRIRIDELASRAQQGALSAEEQAEADSYERIGHFVSLLKSKARQSLLRKAA